MGLQNHLLFLGKKKYLLKQIVLFLGVIIILSLLLSTIYFEFLNHQNVVNINIEETINEETNFSNLRLERNIELNPLTIGGDSMKNIKIINDNIVFIYNINDPDMKKSYVIWFNVERQKVDYLLQFEDILIQDFIVFDNNRIIIQFNTFQYGIWESLSNVTKENMTFLELEREYTELHLFGDRIILYDNENLYLTNSTLEQVSILVEKVEYFEILNETMVLYQINDELQSKLYSYSIDELNMNSTNLLVDTELIDSFSFDENHETLAYYLKNSNRVKFINLETDEMTEVSTTHISPIVTGQIDESWVFRENQITFNSEGELLLYTSVEYDQGSNDEYYLSKMTLNMDNFEIIDENSKLNSITWYLNDEIIAISDYESEPVIYHFRAETSIFYMFELPHEEDSFLSANYLMLLPGLLVSKKIFFNRKKDKKTE